jgi:predicted DNA-binding protein
MEQHLEKLCKLTKRSKSFLIKEALAQYLEDVGDAYIALERLADPKAKYYTNEEVKAMIEAMPDDA